MINFAIKEELQRLLQKKVDNGEFPNEEAVVEEALRCFLIEEPSHGRRQTSSSVEFLEERLPGPFLEDPTVLAPVELPRSGQEIARSYLHDPTRQPNDVPGK